MSKPFAYPAGLPVKAHPKKRKSKNDLRPESLPNARESPERATDAATTPATKVDFVTYMKDSVKAQILLTTAYSKTPIPTSNLNQAAHRSNVPVPPKKAHAAVG